MKKTIPIIVFFLAIGCKNETELSMERGIQYYEWEMTEKAVLEFKYVIHKLSDQSQKQSFREVKILSRAHHNLAIAYAKKKWYIEAAKESQMAFDLFPSEDNRKVLELIKLKKSKQKKAEPTRIDSSR